MPYQPTQNYYYQPTTTQIRQPLIGLKGRPVSGLEEVRAAAVDFDGTVSFFPDLANGNKFKPRRANRRFNRYLWQRNYFNY